MSYMFCHNCGSKVPVNKTKIRIAGICIAAFGVFGWFSFLFAGSGHAFLIASCIFLFGLGMAWLAEDVAKSLMKDKPCPQCGMAQLREEPKQPRYRSANPVMDIPASPGVAGYPDEADEDEPQEKRCPRCGKGTLRLRHGRYGPFMGCSRYPGCRYTRNAK